MPRRRCRLGAANVVGAAGVGALAMFAVLCRRSSVMAWQTSAPDSAIALRELILRKGQAARASGALFTFDSAHRYLADHELGVQYHVRVASSLQKKTNGPGAKIKNPFEPPYEEDLYVCELGPAHRVLLNKFNVIDSHVLVVTSSFEAQEAPLMAQDFSAVDSILEAFEAGGAPGALAFFNRGPSSGFSQPHKHIQVVPFPLCPACKEMPLGEKVEDALRHDRLQMDVPWVHALRRRAVSSDDASVVAAELRELLTDACRELVLQEEAAAGGSWNLLWTRRWLLVVPRRCESFQGIGVNALAFTGSFFVKSEAAVADLENASPTGVLVNAGLSRL